MLKSIEALRSKVCGPLFDTLGPQARLLTVEAHGDEVRGLAFCPGKVVRYVLSANEQIFSIRNLLTLQ